MQQSEAPQLYHRAEELSASVRKRKNLYFEGESWADHQELQTLCQKLLLRHLDYALDKKVENELWTVCFKDYISRLQSSIRDRSPLNKKKATEAQVVFQWLLEAASGFYIVLLEELRAKFQLDFPFLKSGAAFGLAHLGKRKTGSHVSKREKKNAIYLTQHCLVHLGDLSRYRSEARQAESFYRQAIQVSPGSGQAYNQIALLEAGRGNKLASVFFYVRAVGLKFPFPAAASNLSSLLNKLDADQKSLPVKGDGVAINAQTFIPYALRFHALLHHAAHLKTAARIGALISDAVNSLVAAESLSGVELIQIVCLNLFILKSDECDDSELSKDEVTIARLAEDCLAAMFNAFLLPVYTSKQSDALLSFCALPATMLILNWIALNDKVLDQRGFFKRLQIWPSLCKMLNELTKCLSDGKSLSDMEDFPLPEEYDLQAFLPVWPRFKNRVFSIAGKTGLDQESVNLLRGKRIIELGQLLASDGFRGRSVVRMNEDGITFEAVEQKISPEMAKQLKTASVLEDSSSEEEDVAPTMTILKMKSDSSNNEENANPNSKTKSPRASNNVAMNAILKQQQSQQQLTSESDSSKQVSFRATNPPADTIPQPRPSRYSAQVHRERPSGVGMMARGSGGNQWPRQQQQQQQQHRFPPQSDSGGYRGASRFDSRPPPPSRPPSMPPPLVHNPFTSPFQPQLPPNPMGLGHQRSQFQPHAGSSNDHLLHLLSQQQQRQQQQQQAGFWEPPGRSSFGGMAQQRQQPPPSIATRAPEINSGSYSLWSGGPNALLSSSLGNSGGQQQHQPQQQQQQQQQQRGQQQNMFQSGPSALEALLRQQRQNNGQQ